MQFGPVKPSLRKQAREAIPPWKEWKLWELPPKPGHFFTTDLDWVRARHFAAGFMLQVVPRGRKGIASLRYDCGGKRGEPRTMVIHELAEFASAG